MIAGTRQKTIGGTAYRNDPLYAFGKAFVEAANNILTTENYDVFGEPARAMRVGAVKESLKDFFCKNFVNEADTTKTPEQIEDELEGVKEMLENDNNAVMETAYASE